jgi:glutathione S-transferase
MSKPLLFGYYRSSAAYRVRAALAWKGIDFETRPVHLVKGEHRQPDYLDLKPVPSPPCCPPMPPAAPPCVGWLS